MTARRGLVAATATLALALAAGCGGGDENGGGDGGGGGTGGTQAPVSKAQSTFATTCGGCHQMAAADTRGQVGPSLDELKPDKQEVLTAIEEGPSVMPAELLKGREAEQVAEWVAQNAGK